MINNEVGIGQDVDFVKLAGYAAVCAEQWRAWAAKQRYQVNQARHAAHLASLFEEQAKILTAMNQNKVQWTKPARQKSWGTLR